MKLKSITLHNPLCVKKIVWILLFLPVAFIIHGQSIGINESGTAPHPSALLDINSTAKGLLIPRMSTALRIAITAPAAGLLVFDLDKSTIYLFDGQKWQPMLFAGSDANNPPIARSASDGSTGDKFGISVNLSGDHAIIGAYNEDIGAKTDQGAAYIFKREGGTWSEQAKITASDGQANDNFGHSVSISGDYAVVGAPKGGGDWLLQGAAYIFVRTGAGWSQQTKLNASDGVIGEYYGSSVSISGDAVIISAPNATVQYANQGCAYIFVRNGTGWSQQAKLTASNGKFNDYFGFSVSINGDYAIVGAIYNDYGWQDAGMIYFFQRTGNTWTQQWATTAADRDLDDHFGYSVCISGDYAIVGAPNVNDNPFTDNGSAYVYARNGATWVLQEKLNAPDIKTDANFGNTVSISGDYAIVGSFYNKVGLNDFQGSAYIYKRAGTRWNLVRKLDDGDGQSYGLFGSGVGISGYNLIIGANGKNSSKGEVSFLNIE